MGYPAALFSQDSSISINVSLGNQQYSRILMSCFVTTVGGHREPEFFRTGRSICVAHAAEESRVYRGGGRLTGNRHWGEHGHFQSDRCHPAALAASAKP